MSKSEYRIYKDKHGFYHMINHYPDSVAAKFIDEVWLTDYPNIMAMENALMLMKIAMSKPVLVIIDGKWEECK